MRVQDAAQDLVHRAVPPASQRHNGRKPRPHWQLIGNGVSCCPLHQGVQFQVTRHFPRGSLHSFGAAMQVAVESRVRPRDPQLAYPCYAHAARQARQARLRSLRMA